MQHQGAHERLASNQLCTHKGEPALVNNLALRQIVCGIGQPAGLQYRTENFQQALGFNQGCLHKRRVRRGRTGRKLEEIKKLSCNFHKECIYLSKYIDFKRKDQAQRSRNGTHVLRRYVSFSYLSWFFQYASSLIICLEVTKYLLVFPLWKYLSSQPW